MRKNTELSNIDQFKPKHAKSIPSNSNDDDLIISTSQHVLPETSTANCYSKSKSEDLKELMSRIINSKEFTNLNSDFNTSRMWRMIYNCIAKYPERQVKKEIKLNNDELWNIFMTNTSHLNKANNIEIKRKNGFIWWYNNEGLLNVNGKKKRITLNVKPSLDIFIQVVTELIKLSNMYPIEEFKMPDNWDDVNIRYDNIVIYYHETHDLEIKIVEATKGYLREGTPAFLTQVLNANHSSYRSIGISDGWYSHSAAIATIVMDHLLKMYKSLTNIDQMDKVHLFCKTAKYLNNEPRQKRHT